MTINLNINTQEVSLVIKDFIKVYVENSGCKGVVIGLSGGVDSVVVALLCNDVLGKIHTHCLFLPDEATPASDIKHYNLLIEKYDLQCDVQDITSVVKEIVKNCVKKPTQMAIANIKARLRMILLFEHAYLTKSLVCGASNKSELLTGYFTKYGDCGADIMPIGDLYKTQVWQLAKYLQIPEEIILKPPTAGLIKGQTDEKELRIDYQTLDQILVGLEQKRSVNNITKITGIKQSEIERIKLMRVRSQHKRRLPLIPKIGIRTPGLDWRSPIQVG